MQWGVKRRGRRGSFFIFRDDNCG
ncbi:hypothetical protein Gotur_002723 [Gossypium turneri]